MLCKLSRSCLAVAIFNQLAAEFLFQLLRLIRLREEGYGFDIHQPRCHLQKFAGQIQVGLLQGAHISGILLYQLKDRDIVDIQFVLGNQKQKQVQWSLEHFCFIKRFFHKNKSILQLNKRNGRDAIKLMPCEQSDVSRDKGVESAPVNISKSSASIIYRSYCNIL